MTVVRLRKVSTADWERIQEWAGSAEACRYQTWGPNSPEDTQHFVAEALAAWSDADPARRVWVAEADGEGVVGVGELKMRSRLHHQFEIAYSVHIEMWGRGYATAIGQALIDIAAADGAHRVFATCDPRNKGSARVLQKLGMTLEGTLHHTLLLRDGWRDSEMYALVLDEA